MSMERFEATGDPADWPATAQVAGQLHYVPDYTLHHLRLQCLHAALATPDGAAPPPLPEVLARAERYWRFVSGGEEVAEDPRLNTR
jgi:hypothetical protein